METYMKPELEYVDFTTEEITGPEIGGASTPEEDEGL